MIIGIESIGIYTARYVIDLGVLADARGVDPAKYYVGLGQEMMSIAPLNEDVVTLGANAARLALEKVAAREAIGTVIFATETGVDQSKAAGIYLHNLLGLGCNCRVVELKQACYSSTAALQFAAALVARQPEHKVLVVAADIARYGLGTAGEPTQGCGAVAMVVSSEPKLVELEPHSGMYTEDLMDFWRPNYREEALVDGKLSARMYISVLEKAFEDYRSRSGVEFKDIDEFCYHLPFTRMAEKAHARLARKFGGVVLRPEEAVAQIGHSLDYNRIIGNSYTAALYIGLASLLDNNEDDLAGRRIGFYSYGSGCVGEYFSGRIMEGYGEWLHTEHHREALAGRVNIGIEEYERLYREKLPTDGSEFITPKHRVGCYSLVGICDHKRIYESVGE